MTSAVAASQDRTARTPVQIVALIVGIVFLLVGVAGFIPGLTTRYGDLSFAGTGSMAMLLGVFQVSILHNVVHLLFGIVGIIASRSARGAKLFLVVGGIVYAVLWIYGLAVPMTSQANFVPLNSADNWLHLVLAVGMVLLGLVVPGSRRAAQTSRA
ncbi:DUF4383 domain-containing protein [Amnibacterium setariae]|uniref:DUF4383 domain-containing protein n=1 Tax=Amnibacterium setariae TaxID=2306585 RepID=A0A3A1U2A6_9MICO|nr:DUF4383 domain-containing protein [Amnibacterium setariae]RIX30671.1 DUF4383 domain-containing protein [Amnibacterium setariae]